MKFVQRLFESAHVVIVAMFFISAVTLVWFSVVELWGAILPGGDMSVHRRFVSVLQCIGLLTIAVAALELGQTIYEEEIQRSTPISAPTRVRRFLSRFIVVVVIALSIEALVAVFQFTHDSPELLPQAATIGLAAAALLAAWGFFVRCNVQAERLEPEGMQDAKQEDEKVSEGGEGDKNARPATHRKDAGDARRPTPPRGNTGPG